MQDYWVEFGKVALAHALAVASPGPDFALVLKQSLRHGRPTAVWASLGIGCGILLHITYSLLGFAVLVKSSPFWFGVVKYVGAAYLVGIGLQALRARPRDPTAATAGAVAEAPPRPRGAFVSGFLTNALGNPKATLFFLALFTVLISPQTPRWIQAAYGAWMVCATAAWFCFVAYVFANERVRRRFLQHGHWIDRALGLVFLGFAASLLITAGR